MHRINTLSIQAPTLTICIVSSSRCMYVSYSELLHLQFFLWKMVWRHWKQVLLLNNGCQTGSLLLYNYWSKRCQVKICLHFHIDILFNWYSHYSGTRNVVSECTCDLDRIKNIYTSFCVKVWFSFYRNIICT